MDNAPIEKGIVVVSETGEILDVLSSNEGLEDVEFFKGIICPGFVNAHCHLELSHLKGKIEEKTGLVDFIKNLTKIRNNFSAEEIQEAIRIEEESMIANGIVAVGDISNTDVTFSQKSKQNLKYHTFIEAIGFVPSKAHEAFNHGVNLLHTYSQEVNKKVSIAPHAPYSVSEDLFVLIKAYAEKHQHIVSIHNQETAAENHLFGQGKGELYKLLTSFFNLDLSFWKFPKKTSLQDYFKRLPETNKILVHNTFSNKEDISAANSKNTYWCLCPNANLYIENKLPDVKLLMDSNAKIVIGTDSLASNFSLSVFEEMKTLAKYYPEIPLNTLLSWATKNGADALEFPLLGKLKKGTTPGINLISDLETNCVLGEKSRIKNIYLSTI